MSKTPSKPVEPQVFYKIRHRDTGLFKAGGCDDGTGTGAHIAPGRYRDAREQHGWSKTGKTWSKNGLKGHLALFKRENYRLPHDDPMRTFYAIPDHYEILWFSVMGTVVPVEGILPAGAIIDRSTD